jgi:ethanolamine utilization protein EutA
MAELSKFGRIIFAALAQQDAMAASLSAGGQVKRENESLQQIGKLLGETIVSFIADRNPPPVPELLGTEALRHDYHIDEYWFSGGVGELMVNPAADPLLYGDIGGYLAHGLLASLRDRGLVFFIPEHPIRATVIGAGAHSMQLSGSTISIDANTLPLRNLQIIRPFAAGASRDETVSLPEFVCKSIDSALLNHDIEWTQQSVALQLETIAEPNFPTLNAWATALAGAFVTLRGRPPLVIICAQDIAMALGQLIKQSLPAADLVVIDGVQSITGDYIDIGKPLNNQQSLPVVIKDLVFSA